MESGSLQYLESVALVGTFALYWKTLGKRKVLTRPVPSYLPYDEFREAVKDLPDDCAGVDVFSSNATELFKTYRESSAAIEAKIGTVLGFVAGGTGVFALLSTTDKISRPVLSPLLVTAILALIGVFVCAFEGLRPQPRRNPDVAQLADVVLMTAKNAKTRMTALIAWQNLEAAMQIEPIVAYKVRWLQRCYAGFSIGIFALVLNAVTPVRASTMGTTTTTTYIVPAECAAAVKAKTFRCTITATENKQ